MKPTRGESTGEIPGSGRHAAGGNRSGLGHGSRHWLLALGLAGIAARLWLWWISIGSNDSVIWSSHAQHVLAHGLAHTYRTYQSFPQFNHPPLMGLYAAQVWQWSHGGIWEFARWMKLPGLAGEALVMWAMWRFIGLRAFAVYAWLPAAILVSSFHGNTDCLYAALVLLAAIAFDKERYFLSGLLWSASLNVKLLPLFLIPLVFLGVLNRGVASPALQGICDPLREWWMAAGRYVILLAVVGVALLSRYRRKMPMTEQAALGAALFLVLTPGFAVQYVVFAAPLLCFVDFPEGVRWGWISGLFIGAVYWICLL